MQLTTLTLTAFSLSGLAQSLMIQGFTIDSDTSFLYWEEARNDGARFATIRATSGNVALDELFEENWADAEENDFIRAAYHNAQPAGSGTEQAEFFLNHGGQWVANNMTLPGILSIGAASVGDPCWGVNSSHTRQFIDDWVETYYNATEMWPYVHTDLSFFDECTDNWHSLPIHAQLGLIDGSEAPPDDHDLLISYGETWSFWQTREGYEFGGSSVMWNGDLESLRYATRQHDD